VQQLRKQVARLNLIVHDQRQVITTLGAAQLQTQAATPPRRGAARDDVELFHSPSRVPSSDAFGDDVGGIGADEAVLDLPARDATPPPSDATLAAQSEVARFQVLLRESITSGESERRLAIEEAQAEHARETAGAGVALHARARFEAGVESLRALDRASRSRLELSETEDRTQLLQRAGADRRLIEAQQHVGSPQRPARQPPLPTAQPDAQLESKSWSPKDLRPASPASPERGPSSPSASTRRRAVYSELLGEVARVEGRTRARLISHFLDEYEAIVADLEAAMFEADSAAYRQVSSGGFSAAEPYAEPMDVAAAPTGAVMTDATPGSQGMANDLGMLAAAAPVAASDGGLDDIVLNTDFDDGGHAGAARQRQFGSFVSSVGYGADSVAGYGAPRTL
jgi:hypothetical protein